MTSAYAHATVAFAGLIEKIFDEIAAEDRRNHERRMKELQLIENSSARDEYARQLLLDRFLGPVDEAQHQIQNTAKHAQYLAEAVIVYHRDHGLTEQQAHELAGQFRLLAIKITHVESLHDLKLVYSLATLFAGQIGTFHHKDRKYRIDHSIRKNILNPLNTCIATERNFHRRIQFMENIENEVTA